MRQASRDLDDDLMRASQVGSAEMIADLIGRGAKIQENLWGETPMNMAAKGGFNEAIRGLARLGADPSGASRLGWTPAMAATSASQEGALRELASMGADMNARESAASDPGSRREPGYEGEDAIFDQDGAEPAHMGLLTGHELGSKRDGDSALMHACQDEEASESLVGLLIELGADVNLANRHGVSALMLAAAAENPKAVESLLGAGARIDERDVNGCTALMRAIQHCAPSCSLALLAAGADPRMASSGGGTCVDWARWVAEPELSGELDAALARCEAMDLRSSVAAGQGAQAGRPRV